MKKNKWVTGLIASLLILSGCAGSAHVQKDNNVDFSKLRTYAWVDAVDKKDASANKTKINDLTDRKIKASIDRNLQGIGWKEVKNDPDVLLVYDVVIEKENRNVSTPAYSQSFTRWFYNPVGRRWVPVYYPPQFMGYDNSVETVKEGTMTLTMMDANNDKTIWQGWTTSDVNGKRLTDKEIESNVKAIVKKLDK